MLVNNKKQALSRKIYADSVCFLLIFKNKVLLKYFPKNIYFGVQFYIFSTIFDFFIFLL